MLNLREAWGCLSVWSGVLVILWQSMSEEDVHDERVPTKQRGRRGRKDQDTLLELSHEILALCLLWEALDHRSESVLKVFSARLSLLLSCDLRREIAQVVVLQECDWGNVRMSRSFLWLVLKSIQRSRARHVAWVHKMLSEISSIVQIEERYKVHLKHSHGVFQTFTISSAPCFRRKDSKDIWSPISHVCWASSSSWG